MRWQAYGMVALLLAGGALTAGCDPEGSIQLKYDRPAQVEIPAAIRALGIAEFGGQTAEDRKWGDIASDRLAARLDAYNKTYNRYQLVDRKRLKALLDEKDLQAAFSDSSQALKAGQLAQVDAMIYGTVSVTVRDEPATRMVLDPLGRRMREVSYTRRYVMAAANFTIDNVHTGKTLATVAAVREFNSEKSGKKGDAPDLGALIGVGGAKTPPADQIVSGLIEECVQEFVAKVSPHQVMVQEKLAAAKTEAVRTGNTLAAAGAYADALAAYEAAIRDQADDHAAIFNAGLMCEATGKLDKAGEYYDRAFKLKPEKQYIEARQRVRQEAKP